MTLNLNCPCNRPFDEFKTRKQESVTLLIIIKDFRYTHDLTVHFFFVKFLGRCLFPILTILILECFGKHGVRIIQNGVAVLVAAERLNVKLISTFKDDIKVE